MDDNEPLNELPSEPIAAARVPAEPPQSWVASLLRLWMLRGIGPVPSRPATPILIGLSMLWLLLWVAIDWWDALPDPQFLIAGAPLLAWYALAVLALAALLRRRSRPMLSNEAALMLCLGSVPVPLCLAAVAGPYLNPLWLLGAVVAAAVYSFLYLARGLRAFTGEPQRVAAIAGIAFIAGFVWLTDALDVIPDVWVPAEVEATADNQDGQADAESLLFEQAARIDRALAAIGETPASPQAFFLGFAGVGEQKVFAQEIGLASRVLSERYGMNDRRLSLINDERDLEGAPLASVSGLKYALRGLAARMNLDRDVLFLSISSHGAQDPAIAVSNSQLPLNDLTEEDLAEALSDSAIKWRVIIISACYAGGFIDSLKNPQTIVITAAAADRTSFGCSNDRDLTYFGEAFYRDALPDARSLRDAFEKARSAIALRERREHVDPSKPQAYFGAELEAKLGSMSSPPP
ncbi:MAG TPA: C13 family peptidase [Steroidobacteraceae bacterium]|nr:C13 family peptidase [Steroidobacteraceae bacterium]